MTTTEGKVRLTGRDSIGELSLKLAEAALVAHQRGDKVEAAFFSIKAAETLQLAKALGWKLPSPEPAGRQALSPEREGGADG